LTALGAAAHRAAHQILEKPHVFDDPLAAKILGQEGEAALRAKLDRATEGAPLRAFIAARSRFAEDRLHDALERGVRQYVVLGAGLDTSAYRNAGLAPDLRIFEVDHPATQAWKRTCLASAGIAIPPLLAFVPLDFERRTLREDLEAGGLRPGEPAFFSWLGVVPYLERSAILETLGLIASWLPSGTEVVLDYGEPPSAFDPALRAVYEARAQRVADIGEPWRTFFEPDDIARELRRAGFADVEDLGAAALNARYFAGRADRLEVGPAGHVVRARS